LVASEDDRDRLIASLTWVPSNSPKSIGGAGVLVPAGVVVWAKDTGVLTNKIIPVRTMVKTFIKIS
jgi:hypothetical protein